MTLYVVSVIFASLDGMRRHVSTPGPQVQPLLHCQVVRSNLFCSDAITVGHAMMHPHDISHPFFEGICVRSELLHRLVQLGGLSILRLCHFQRLECWVIEPNYGDNAFDTRINSNKMSRVVTSQVALFQVQAGTSDCTRPGFRSFRYIERVETFVANAKRRL
jgi:hypothetical protein